MMQQGGYKGNNFNGGGAKIGSLYVGDLSTKGTEVTEKELHDHFAAIGPLASIRVCRDAGSRKSLGYAYVNYMDTAHAQQALKDLNFSQIAGQPCRIMWAARDPSQRKNPNTNVFVKNLDKKIDQKAMFETFSLFGTILSCKIATDEKGRSKGYGFVHYEDEDSAKQAIERVNNMQIGEKTVFVGKFENKADRPEAENPVYNNMYVKNFPNDYEEEQIKEMFNPFGQITSVCVNTDNKGRKSAFVCFSTVDEAAAATKALNG